MWLKYFDCTIGKGESTTKQGQKPTKWISKDSPSPPEYKYVLRFIEAKKTKFEKLKFVIFLSFFFLLLQLS